MHQPSNGNGHKRTDDITMNIPWLGGVSIRASGTLVVLIISVLAGVGLLFAMLLRHDDAQAARQVQMIHAQQETNDSINDLMCVLTLTSEERIEARRGTELSKWCLFLNQGNTGRK